MTPDGSRAEGANLPARQPRPSLPAAGGAVAAIIPRTVEEMFRVADAIHGAGLAPTTLKNVQQVTVAIMAGAELGLAPFQAVQSFAVINGRPSIWGDAIPALLWRNGFKIEEWFDDDDKPTKAFCKITRPEGQVIERTFSLDDAKAANLLSKQGPWQTARKRMLQMRARAFAARDGAADALKGMQVREEVQDYAHDVTPGREAATNRRAEMLARMQQNQHQAPDTGFDAGHVASELGDTPHDPETGEVQEEPAQDAEFEEAETDKGPGDFDAVKDAIYGEDPPEDDEVLETHSPSAGEPGYRAPVEEKAPPAEEPTLAQRADDYERRLRAATNTTKLTSIRNANSKLRQAIEKEMPARWHGLDELFNELYRQLDGGDE